MCTSFDPPGQCLELHFILDLTIIEFLARARCKPKSFIHTHYLLTMQFLAVTEVVTVIIPILQMRKTGYTKAK